MGDIDAAGRDQPDAEPDHSNFCRHPEKPVTPKDKYAHSEQGNISGFLDVETISARATNGSSYFFFRFRLRLELDQVSLVSARSAIRSSFQVRMYFLVERA